MGAEHHVDPGCLPGDLAPVLLREAAADGDLHARVLGLDRGEMTEVSVEFVVGVLPHRTRVEHDHVCAALVAVEGHVPGILEESREPLRVVDVHLAAVGAELICARDLFGTRLVDVGKQGSHNPARVLPRDTRYSGFRSAASTTPATSAGVAATFFAGAFFVAGAFFAAAGLFLAGATVAGSFTSGTARNGGGASTGALAGVAAGACGARPLVGLRPAVLSTTAPAVSATTEAAAFPTCWDSILPRAAVPLACSTTLPVVLNGCLIELIAVSAALPRGFFAATSIPFVAGHPCTCLNRIETRTRAIRVGTALRSR